MTQEQINEGNKLIALSDGWQFGKLTGWLSGTYETFYKKEGDEIVRTCPLYKLQYHSNWQWQIPVWAKLNREEKFPSFYDLEYLNAVRDNKPEAGFEIIVSILKRITN